MTSAVPDILARIVEHKQTEFSSVLGRLDQLEAQAELRSAERRDFAASLRAHVPAAVFSEIKKASPSKGLA